MRDMRIAICDNGERFNLGLFKTQEEARDAYNYFITQNSLLHEESV